MEIWEEAKRYVEELKALPVQWLAVTEDMRE